MSLGRAGLICLHVFVLSFALSTIPGVLVAYDASLSVAAFCAIWLSTGLYFFTALLARSESARGAVAVGLLSASFAFAVYTITQYRYMGFEKGEFVVPLGMLTSFLPDFQGPRPHANAAASFMEVALPLGVALAATSRRKASKLVLWVMCATILYAIFLTASRGSWVALFVAALLALGCGTFLLRPRTDRPAYRRTGVTRLAVAIAIVAVVGLGAVLLLAPSPPHVPSFLASTVERAGDRLTLYLNSFYLARDYLFTGAGLGDTFTMVYSRYSLLIYVPFLYYPHNLFLSVWLNQGLPGLVSFAGIGVSLGAAVVGVARVSKQSPLFHGAWLGAVVSVVHGLTDAAQYDPASYWVMPLGFIAVGLAAAEARRILTSHGTSAALHGRQMRMRVGAVFAGATLLCLFVIFIRPISAAWHANMGALAETRSELTASLSAADRAALNRASEDDYRSALSIDPDWSPAQRRAGNLLVRLERFEEAVPLLEAAQAAEPRNPAAQKGLGLAYAWLGRTGESALLLAQVPFPSDMKLELRYWAFYWRDRNNPLLSAYALETLRLAYPGAATADDLAATADLYRQAGQPR